MFSFFPCLLRLESLNVVFLMLHVKLLVATVVPEFEVVLRGVDVFPVLESLAVVVVFIRLSFAALFFFLLLGLVSVEMANLLVAAYLHL